MEIKQVLKTVKLYESTISMILGALVLAIAAFLVFSYFRNLKVGTVSTNGTQNQTAQIASHKVVAGETLWSIAEKYYGDGFKWQQIAEANSISNPESLEKDTKLSIPETELEVKVTTTVKSEETKALKSELPSSYTVAKGDDLWKISVKVYGNGHKWPEIAKLNRITNANVIFVGSQLNLPK